ncbi:hypothetical protein CDAR_390041 [Caerostris darwini]|uniref:TRASH domain-containing protein n=1 Tax=Caerostris darwini TaxID=1538125 RepID=A0AAV4QWF1_9ARAC|nr:hypothetical protein CDAR_390041 [Caerostris darwini]
MSHSELLKLSLDICKNSPLVCKLVIMPKARKQSAATLAKKARARKNKVPLQNNAEKPLSELESIIKSMEEPASDMDVVQEPDDNVVSSSMHLEKENGFCSEDVSDDTLIINSKRIFSKPTDDNVTQSNSNHDVNMSGDEITDDSTNDSKNLGENKNEIKLHQNNSDKEDSQLDFKDSPIDESHTPENHKDVYSEENSNETESGTSASIDYSSSVVEKPISSEESSSKPNSIPDRLFDESPKCSPEIIIADDVPLEGKSNNDDDSSDSKVKAEETEGNEDSKINESVDSTNAESGEKESESKNKHDKSNEKKSGSKKKKGKTCAQCNQKKKLHFRIVFQGKAYQLCSESCYKDFKAQQIAPKPSPPPPRVEVNEGKCGQCEKKITSGQGFYSSIGDLKVLCSEECLRKYHNLHGPPRNCSQCKKKIESAYSQLTWETMVFCNEDCLGKYQSFLGSHCTCCQTPVQQISLGKYCVCFGADIRQFCSGVCLEEFKKGLKVCSYCQTDLSAGTDGFLAPVGDKGQFKDFCSQQCMERYELMNISKGLPDVQECAHCKKQGSFKIQVKFEDKVYSLCCDMCVAGFRCTSKIVDKMCDTCYKFFKSGTDDFSLKYEGTAKHFCTKACLTLFVLSHRKIIQCIQCKVKKYTFDMIERLNESNQVQMFCSLNCLSLFRVNLSAISSKSIRCDNCTKNIPAQYHLTMSDGSIRNFCSYQCVLYFQNRFPAVPLSSASNRQTTITKTGVKTTSSTTPVIANVVSLAQPRPLLSAQGKNLAPQTLVSVRQQGPSLAVLSAKPQVSSSTITSSSISVAAPIPGNPPVLREIVVRPPAPKSVKNKSASCKPLMQTKGVNAKLQTCHKAVQTDERPMPLILPIPIPIYVPTPLHMFSRPVPCPVPFPVPIPVPIVIPSSKAQKEEGTSTEDKFNQWKANGCGEDQITSENKPGSIFQDLEDPSEDNHDQKPMEDDTKDIIDLETDEDCTSNVPKIKSPTKRKYGDVIEREVKKPKLDKSEDEEKKEELNKVKELMKRNCEDSTLQLKVS